MTFLSSILFGLLRVRIAFSHASHFSSLEVTSLDLVLPGFRENIEVISGFPVSALIFLVISCGRLKDLSSDGMAQMKSAYNGVLILLFFCIIFERAYGCIFRGFRIKFVKRKSERCG